MKAAYFPIRLQVSLLSLIVEEDKHEDLEKLSKAGWSRMALIWAVNAGLSQPAMAFLAGFRYYHPPLNFVQAERRTDEKWRQ